jgi:hypothetical protein
LPNRGLATARVVVKLKQITSVAINHGHDIATFSLLIFLKRIASFVKNVNTCDLSPLKANVTHNIEIKIHLDKFFFFKILRKVLKGRKFKGRHAFLDVKGDKNGEGGGHMADSKKSWELLFQFT